MDNAKHYDLIDTLISKADELLNNGDYKQSLETSAQALAEMSPGDPRWGALYHLISDAFYVIPDDLLLNVLFCKVMAERQFYPEASERFIQVQNILERDGMTSPLISLLYIECANRLVEGRRMAGAFDGRPTPDIPINTEIMIEAVKICPRQPGIPIYLKMPELN